MASMSDGPPPERARSMARSVARRTSKMSMPSIWTAGIPYGPAMAVMEVALR